MRGTRMFIGCNCSDIQRGARDSSSPALWNAAKIQHSAVSHNVGVKGTSTGANSGKSEPNLYENKNLRGGAAIFPPRSLRSQRHARSRLAIGWRPAWRRVRRMRGCYALKRSPASTLDPIADYEVKTFGRRSLLRNFDLLKSYAERRCLALPRYLGSEAPVQSSIRLR